MSLHLIRTAARVELMDEPQEVRLLLLLLAAGKKSNKPLDGLTKMAKLDFLLRYPNCLERALIAVGKNPASAKLLDFERETIEAKMIRFRYGPWDHRYRRWLSLIVARGLAATMLHGRTVQVGLTEPGRVLASDLAVSPEFQDMFERSRLVVQAFGGMSGARLREFIYKTFPELNTMRWGEEIIL